MSDAQYKRAFYRYCYGLIIGLVLVYIAYFTATNGWLDGGALAGLLLGVALPQFLVQMIVFLHVGDEKQPRWTLWSILYVFAMLAIIVGASLWIMANMNYNMHMTPEQMEEYMLEQNKKGF